MSQLNLSDQELIRQYLSGEENALHHLIVRHKEKIYTSIYIMVRDRMLAEDLFQETFIKIVSTLNNGKYNEEGKFIQWATRVARNLVIDHFRRIKKMPKISDSEGKDVFSYIYIKEETQEDAIVQDEREVKLRQLIEHLPPEQREVLVLRHFANMSFKEISDFTDVSINTALGRMRYALNNLRKLIVKHKLEF